MGDILKFGAQCGIDRWKVPTSVITYVNMLHRVNCKKMLLYYAAYKIFEKE